MKEILSKIKSKFKKTSSSNYTGSYTLPSSKFSLKTFPQKIFNPTNRPVVHRIFLLTFFAVLSYSIGTIVAHLLTPEQKIAAVPVINDFSERQSARANISPKMKLIRDANLFHLKEASLASNKEDKPCESAEAETSLPLKLLNTVVLQDTVKSIAAVQVRSEQELKNFRIGEKVESLARIEKIHRLELVIKNLQTGACELVVNQDAKKDKESKIKVMGANQAKEFLANQNKFDSIQNEGNNFKIPKKLLAESLANPAAILTQARAIQIDNPDGSISYKIVEIEPGSVYAKLGVQNDDIITAVNGKIITSPNEMLGLFSSLASASSLSLGINRQGSDVTQSYEFVNQ